MVTGAYLATRAKMTSTPQPLPAQDDWNEIEAGNKQIKGNSDDYVDSQTARTNQEF
jgi:hypothetical protein